jgi:hypothetical protein
MQFQIIKGNGSQSKAPARQDRITWPFKDMDVTDEVIIPDSIAGKGQRAAHAYGRATGKRFTTIMTTDGLLVSRVV